MKQHLGKFLALSALCLLLAGCAQTGPPLPPSLELPKPPADLRASCKGNRVTLTWSEPTLTTDRQSVRYLGPTQVCRSLDPEIATCGNPAATLPAPPVTAPSRAAKKMAAAKPATEKSNSPRPATQVYVDTLPESLLREDASAEITYAVEILNRNARSAGLSNRVHVPAAATLPPPGDLTAQLTGDGVTLHWTSAGESRTVPPSSTAIESIGAMRPRAKMSLLAKSPWATLDPRISPTPALNGRRPTFTASLP